MYTPIHKRVLQHVSINAQVVYQPDFECPPDIIDLHLQLKSKGEAQGAQYNGFIYVGGGGIPLETSILSGRLNIVQTDRQKGIIPQLPSPPTPVSPLEVLSQ